MDTLVQASLAVRTLTRRGYGLALIGALTAHVALGGATASLGPALVVPLVVFVALFTSRLVRKLSRRGEASALVDVELGALLALALVAALVRFDGGLSGRYAPVLYVLVALVAAFARPLAALLVVLFVVGLEALVRLVVLRDGAFDTLATHALFVAAFGLLQVASLRAEVLRIRITSRKRLDDEVARVREDARSYRLLGAGDAGGQDERSEDRLARSSVEEIHQSVLYALELLRSTLGLHTAVLLWLNDAGTHLRISELSTGSDDVNDAPFRAGGGMLGAVVARRERLSLHGLKPSYKVPYYVGACPVRALAAIPILDEERLCGVLAIDRTQNLPFTELEEEIAAKAARFCLRAIDNERVFVQLERAKVEQGKLYRAAQALGAARSEQEVLDAGVCAAREIASFDFAAVTLYDETTGQHEVRAVKSASGELEELVGARFAHNTGLVSMVVQNRYPLPYRGDFDAAHQAVLTRSQPFPRVPSLLVLPLLMRDRVLGTLLLGARRRHAFGEAVRPTLEVLASHLAVSLANARMVQKLELLATTDGLTGLLNKRAALEAAQQKVASAIRFRRPLSLLVTDIDLFKRVNDTYGHDVGDQVIKGLADVLRRQKRVTDVVGRYGGEEFVIVCEQTDEAGAMLLAERIREDLKAMVFSAPIGDFGVSCSLGVATLPNAATDWDTLFRAADEALYVSKRSGRDRSTAFQSRRSEVRERARTSAPRSVKAG